MSLIYKDKKDQKVEVEILLVEGRVFIFNFSSDCGKFGAKEGLSGYKLTPERLLQILQERKDYSEEEIH